MIEETGAGTETETESVTENTTVTMTEGVTAGEVRPISGAAHRAPKLLRSNIQSLSLRRSTCSRYTGHWKLVVCLDCWRCCAVTVGWIFEPTEFSVMEYIALGLQSIVIYDHPTADYH